MLHQVQAGIITAAQGPITNHNCSPSASRFHSNPDILGEICEYLSSNDDLEELDSVQVAEGRQNLAWLALTCKAFLEPALDQLWRSLNTLYPLFKILPAFIQTDGTHVLRGTITPEDWDRFDWYARRVKKFCYTRDPDNLDIAMHVYFRMAQLRTSPILPSLRHLYCPEISQQDFLISGVCLFLTPSLQVLEFHKITSVEDKLSGTFLHTLWNDGAQLDTIIFKGSGLSPGTLDLILNFPSLRSLELTGMGPAMELDWLKKVGAMPKLDDLALDFTLSRIEVVEEDLGFRDLKSLMVTAPLSFTRSILPYLATPSLETIVSVSCSDSQNDRTKFVEEVVERWGSTIRSFSLVHLMTGDNMEDIQMVTLAPLIPIKSLTGFRLEGYSFDLTDDNIRILGSAWPNLTKLLLPFLGSERVRPSIESLRILKELCPKLVHLRLPLDTSELPAFVPPPIAVPRVAPPPEVLGTAAAASSSSSSSSSSEAAAAAAAVEGDADTMMAEDSGQSSSPSSSTSPAPSVPSNLPPTGAPFNSTDLPSTSASTLPSSSSSSNPTLSSLRKHPHALQRLTISTSDDSWDSRDQLHLARHIDHLFPRLRHVSAFEGRDEERWVHVHDIVQAFQTVRNETLEQRRRGEGWFS
ncbi:hypothetical protein EST38_g10149 [Candolleomyces aberdarensis]|uniref:F-box domain-containing protein n=1 Tax=Candolleomyces aberdarensis TaxID=2316362 RepID=A0A4Q2DBD4_9AGAR|nr:hypothetical protein EST38_g10149 [Candolleomyces aberdarensis]